MNNALTATEKREREFFLKSFIIFNIRRRKTKGDGPARLVSEKQAERTPEKTVERIIIIRTRKVP